jgi:cellulose synthase/poly-beta-1,6-N-acetylglucosamine synthase-like glycosyltransferase
MIIFLQFILLVIFCYLALCTGYNLLFAIAGWFRQRSSYTHTEQKKYFAILIPTYKEDHIIIQTVKNALSQDYPNDKYDIIVIADKLQPKTLIWLEQQPIQVVRVSFKKSTKAKSLKFALQQLPDSLYDIVMILDADNQMGKGCLEKTNHAFREGFQMVQLHRTAKNKNTATAILDAISEEIGNHILRKGHRALGLSASLIGSGMAFDYRIFKSLLMELDIENNPAEDREINAEFLKKGIVCEYIENAYVYDEKVQTKQVLERQRIRWISAQMYYIKQFWATNPLKTMSINIHYSDYALQTLILPRSILLVLSFLITMLSLVLLWLGGYALFPGLLSWTLLFVSCILSLIIGIGNHISRVELAQAALYFPVTFWSFLKALVQSTPKQQEFIHTPKEYMHDHRSTIYKDKLKGTKS